MKEGPDLRERGAYLHRRYSARSVLFLRLEPEDIFS